MAAVDEEEKARERFTEGRVLQYHCPAWVDQQKTEDGGETQLESLLIYQFQVLMKRLLVCLFLDY